MSGRWAPSGRWVGRSYAHLVLPRPHLDEECLGLLDEAVRSEPGWRVVDPHTPPPLLFRRWRHERGATVVAVVLGWYPLVLTVGTDRRASTRVRRARQRVVDAVVGAGGRTVADRELERLVERTRERWQRAIAAHAAVERQLALTERRYCPRCGAWSVYSAVHCSGCGARFTAADDTDRDARGRAAGEVMARAQEELARLGGGDGLFADWPWPTSGPATVAEPSGRAEVAPTS